MGVRKSPTAQPLDEFDDLTARIAWMLAPADEKAEIRNSGDIDRRSSLIHGTVEDHGDDSDLLLSIFGDEIKVAAARKMHRHVQDRLDAGARPYSGRRLLEPHSAGTSSRLTSGDVADYINDRAPTLGFSPADVLGRMQGARSPRHDPLKRARSLIGAELVERGASLRTIGQVFGLSAPVVMDLRDAGQGPLREKKAARMRDVREQLKLYDEAARTLSVPSARSSK